MPELKPCPFCGGRAEINDSDAYLSSANSIVICTKCKAKTRVIHAALDYCAHDIVADLWNTRIGELVNDE